MSMFVADFETTKEPDGSTRVWAFGHCEIGNVDNFDYGTDIDSFLKWCKKGRENKTVYFHNLRFDGEFLFHYLLSNGFEYSEKPKDKSFNCIISSDGQFYQIKVTFKKLNKRSNSVTFLDSHKKLPFPVKTVAKVFGLPILKGDIDHDIYRPVGHVITPDELEYLKHDVQIVAMALGVQMEQELDRMTIGGDAMHDFKAGLAGGDIKRGRKLFERYFPIFPLHIHNQMKPSYKGGFTYANPIHTGKDIDKGVVFDINSMYPWAMYTKNLPYGMPIYYKGEYKYDEGMPLYIQRIFCTFTLKEGHIPTIQIKENNRYKATEYLTSNIDKMGNDEPVELVLTNVDLELFLEHYIVEDIEYLDGYKFKSCCGMFNRYIDHWMKVKIDAEETGNEGLRTLAKLMLNNLYGKFGTNPDITGRYPVLQEDGSIGYDLHDPEFTDPVYIPMASFITAYCRDNIIRSAQNVYDRFIYADTDSLHLIGEEMPPLHIHKTELGAWKHESTFTRARFLRAKTYVEDIDGELHVKCAGMPDNVKELVTWDNFHMGLSLHGKLTPKHVKGGVILEPINFTIA